MKIRGDAAHSPGASRSRRCSPRSRWHSSSGGDRSGTPPPANPAPAQPPSARFSPYDLAGAYRRSDGALYGRPEVALYGAGSGYNEGTVAFDLRGTVSGDVSLVLTGLDDERAERCNLQVLLNGAQVFNGADSFPNTPTTDNGEGGGDRYWGQMRVTIPASALRQGRNTLTLRNTTPWQGSLGIPYILISDLRLE